MNVNASVIVNAIRGLGSEDSKERKLAAEKLRGIGSAATWPLIQAVHPVGKKTRHEALRILVQLADPGAVDLFAENLEDPDSECRWLAAEGLGALGEVGLVRTLTLLLEYPRNEPLLHGLHHALKALEKAGFHSTVAPVLRAFQGSATRSELPKAAHEALSEWRRARQGAGPARGVAG